MVSEQKILSTLISDREAFDAVNDHLDESDLSSEGTLILSSVRDFYSRDDSVGSCDVDVLLGGLFRRLPNPKHYGAIESVLRNLPKASAANITKEILEAKAYSTGLKLAAALNGTGSKDGIARLLEQYNKLFGASEFEEAANDEEVSGLDLTSLVKNHFDEGSLIPFRPDLLNERLDGGARAGHHILVFAPTEMGKTLFAINLVSGFLARNLSVLYVGNEDPIVDIQIRLASNLTGLNKHEIKANPAKAMAGLAGTGVDQFHIVEMSPGTFPRIQTLVTKYRPKIVVLDQLRNIDVKQDQRTQALERAATEARNLGKRNGCVVISIAQAGDSASGRRVLTRGDVDGSNVGIPGQCDAMVGIGATAEEEERGFRTISFPKNKLGGDHRHFSCSFDTQYSRVLSHAQG